MKKATKKAANQQDEEVQHVQFKLELPEILSQVEYKYSNHARLSSNKWEIRIAFGDLDPTGSVRPSFGVILPHLAAKGLLKALERMVESAEKRLGRPIEDPDEGKIEIELHDEREKP